MSLWSVLQTGQPRLGDVYWHREQLLRVRFALRVELQRGCSSAAERPRAYEAEGVDSGHFEPRHGAQYKVREERLDGGLGDLAADCGRVLGLARDDAYVGDVALVAAAAVGQGDQRDGDGVAAV